MSWFGVQSPLNLLGDLIASPCQLAIRPSGRRGQPDPAVQARALQFRAAQVCSGRAGADQLSIARIGNIKQEQAIKPPCTKDVNCYGTQPRLYLWVQNPSTEGAVERRGKIDGQVVREPKSSGPYGVCQVMADKP
ncbi:hypothetical protein [Nonomuraea sp. NPDC048901]|uniref:hypothetical protein n=1 Tax=Nonomuraea sp. NPDC048901 TaxID=3155627 RepID=UPI0033FE8AC7